MDKKLNETETKNNTTLFEGDNGTINFDSRRAITHLFSGPIYQNKHSELWAAVINSQDKLESLANNLNVKLIVDLNKQECYFQPINELDCSINPLRKLHLNFYDSILWTFLSEILLTSDSKGESAIVKKDDIVSHLNRFEAVSNNDAKKHRDSINSSINKADNNGVLTKLKSSFDIERYRINSILSVLLNADQVMLLKDVLNEYKNDKGQSNA
jgi:hypothetical protein